MITRIITGLAVMLLSAFVDKNTKSRSCAETILDVIKHEPGITLRDLMHTSKYIIRYVKGFWIAKTVYKRTLGEMIETGAIELVRDDDEEKEPRAYLATWAYRLPAFHTEMSTREARGKYKGGSRK